MPTTPLGRRRTKDDFSLDIRHQLLVAQVRPVFTYWQASNYTQPESLHLSLLRASINALGCVDRVLGRRVGCMQLFFLYFSFKNGALFRIGLPLFSVACRKLAIMLSSGFATDDVNLQQINYLLAHGCTHTPLSAMGLQQNPASSCCSTWCNPCGNIHEA